MPDMYATPHRPGFLGGFPWSSFAVFGITVVVGNLAATAHTARRLVGYDLGSIHPFSWIFWFYRARINPPAEVRNALLGAFVIAVVSVLIGGILARIMGSIRIRRLSSGSEDIHGSAKFATKDDVRFLLKKTGLLVGGFPDGDMLRYLRHAGPESVIVIAPPRSGKGVSLVIPTLLDHQANAVVHDTKGELWAITAGYRQGELGHKCLKFSPVESESAGYNPFAEVRLGTDREVSDTQNIMNMLVRTTEATAQNKHWYDTAESLGLGLALHALYLAAAEDRVASPVDVFNLLTPDGMSLRDYLALVVNYEHAPGWTHPEIRRHIEMQRNRSDDEFDSVVSTLSTAFLVFTDPLVARATSHSDFRLAELMDNSHPISLYVTVPPSDKKRLQPLIRLLFTQIIQRNTETMDYQKPSVGVNDRLLMMIDEAGSLGRMDAFADSISYMPGYNIQAYLIFHSVGQVIEHYGRNNSIMGSTHVKVAFAPNTKETAEFLSDMTGKTTVPRANYSFSGDRNSLYGPKSMTGHVDYIARPLLTPDEVSRMRGIESKDGRLIPGDMLVFVAGHKPIFGMQAIYLADPEMVRRAAIRPKAIGAATVADLKTRLEAYVN